MTDSKTLADRIEDLLPQTQCTKCGYDGCRPYAEAIAAGTAGYDQCPPGGAEGVARLAKLLGKPVIPLNQAHGVERARPVAFIDEQLCIGCTLCMQACPVDAIVGAPKQMHTIVAELCTGCDRAPPRGKRRGRSRARVVGGRPRRASRRRRGCEEACDHRGGARTRAQEEGGARRTRRGAEEHRRRERRGAGADRRGRSAAAPSRRATRRSRRTRPPGRRERRGRRRVAALENETVTA
nr:RnfABCDGE type electron transport complex subunit B [Burkholderia mallei]